MLTGVQLYPFFKECSQVDTDTRSIHESSIFFALKGENFNGNKFAAQALESGARYAVIDEPEYKINDNFLLVDDVLTALQDLAREHRKQLTIPVIGITGSNGKTTTKELVKAVLSEKFKTFATYGNLNNHIGVPLSILAIDESYEMAIIEMGANHQKEIALLSSIAMPDAGLITNIGKAHLEGFGGIEGVKKGKGELYDYLKSVSGHIFTSADSLELVDLLNNYKPSTLYGKSYASVVTGELIAADPFLHFNWKRQKDNASYLVKSNLTGSYNIDNMLGAIAVGLHFNLNPEQINAGIESYFPANNRSQLVETPHYKIVADYYNANPTSMKASIEAFNQMKADVKWIFLGDMLELGPDSFSEHSAIIGLLHELKFENVVLVGPLFMECKENSPYLHFRNSVEATEWLQNNKPLKANILVKGSRGIKMENIMKELSS